jgi:hypothetical protein
MLALLGLGCMPGNPDATAAIGQQVVEMGDAIATLQQIDAELQGQVDSLRFVVARQDTIIRQLANLAGVPIPATPYTP